MPDTNIQAALAEDMTAEERFDHISSLLKEIRAVALMRPGEEPGMMALRLTRIGMIAGRAAEYAVPVREAPTDEPAMSL